MLPRLYHFSGDFHPLVVHFPIALLISACLFELARRRHPEAPHSPGAAAFSCLMLGAVSAALASLMGWASAETAGHRGPTADILFNHRWLGIAAAVGSALAALTAILARTRKTYRPFAFYRFSLIVSALAVSVAAHFGGALIYGEGYLSAALADLRAPVPAPPAPAESPTTTTISFTRDIRPIFADRCYSCHGPDDEIEGDYRLDSREAALRGGESGQPAILPGNSAASPLIDLISTSDSLSRMPPKGKPLTAAQISLIAAWIDQGATWE